MIMVQKKLDLATYDDPDIVWRDITIPIHIKTKEQLVAYLTQQDREGGDYRVISINHTGFVVPKKK